MKIFCVGRNYVAHAKELGNAVPEEPVIFMKPKSALLQAHTPFYYPEFTNELHYECELVLRVSKKWEVYTGKICREILRRNYGWNRVHRPGYPGRNEREGPALGKGESVG